MAEGPQGVRAGRAYVEVGVDPTYKRGINEAEKRVQSFGAQLDKLKARFGEGSLLKRGLDISVGAGAAAGITMLGRALESATAKALDLKKQLQDGQVAAGDAVAEFVKGLPVLGSFAVATENIIDLFTGIKSEAAAALKAAADAIAAIEEANRKRKAMEELGNAGGLGDRNLQRPIENGAPPIPGIAGAFREAGQEIAAATKAFTDKFKEATGFITITNLRGRAGLEPGILDRLLQVRGDLKRYSNDANIPTIPTRQAIGGSRETGTIYNDQAIAEATAARRDFLATRDALFREERRLSKLYAEVQPKVANFLEQIYLRIGGAAEDAVKESGGAAVLLRSLFPYLGAAGQKLPPYTATVPFAPGVDPDDVRMQNSDSGGIRRTAGIGGIPMSPEYLGQVEEQVKAVETAVAEAMRFSSAGTFNAAAIQGLQGAGQVQQLNRIAIASEETARELKTRKPLVFR
jgi:hypothetical protein